MLRKAGGLSRLLMTLHPEFAWNESLFESSETHPPGFWRNVVNRRACLEKFAGEVGITKVTLTSPFSHVVPC